MDEEDTCSFLYAILKLKISPTLLLTQYGGVSMLGGGVVIGHTIAY